MMTSTSVMAGVTDTQLTEIVVAVGVAGGELYLFCFQDMDIT
jgi:biotin synthase-related radical SAM superfamily protein